MDIQISKKLNLKKKEVDDVLGGEDAWKNVDRTQGMSDFLCWMSVEIFAVMFSQSALGIVLCMFFCGCLRVGEFDGERTRI